MQKQPVIQEVNYLINNYYKESIDQIEGLSFSQWDTLKRVIFYSDSKYLEGNTDAKGRDIPFFNISNYAVNVAVRATDFDTKDITVVADNEDSSTQSFVINHELKDWFKKAKFANTLNEMGETRARYGGLLVKRVQRDTLEIDVVNWKNTVTDQVDIDNGVIIERHWMSPIDLSKKKKAWDNVDEAIEIMQQKKREDGRSEDKVLVIEVEGEFDTSYITGDEQETGEYSLQKHFIAGWEDGEQVLLYSEEKKATDYKYLPWQKIPGRGLGRGVVEEAFEAQTWVNDAKVKEKEIMEYASKIGFKSTDPQITEQSLDDLDNGFILSLSGGDFAPVNTVSNAIPAFSNLIQSWEQQYRQASSTPEAITGETMPSGTPFRSLAVQNQEARSFFDYRKEEMGQFIEEIINEWVIPYLIKKINKKHILTSDYTTEDIKKIDKAFGIKKANEKLVKDTLAGKVVTAEEYNRTVDAFSEMQSTLGNTRFLEVPDKFFDNWQGRVTTVTTGEQYNKQVVLESLMTIMQMVQENPDIVKSPLFSRAVELSGAGISPIQIYESTTQDNRAGQGTPEGAGSGANQPVGAADLANALQRTGGNTPTAG